MEQKRGKTHRIGPSLIDTARQFATEEACHAYLEAARWPKGVTCIVCGHSKVSKFTVKGKTRTAKDGTTKQSPDRFMYQCLNSACKKQFATTTGTIFSDTHLPLSKWMMAVALMCNAKKGLSAKQMERDLGVSYKTAWFLCHRIRKAMDEGVDGMFTGTVEVDETYVGGKFDKRRSRAKYDKPAVFGMIERETGKVVAGHIPGQVNNFKLHGILGDQVSKDARIMSDESPFYKGLTRKGWKHEIVVHSSKEWVRGECHTQEIDGFWGLLKRGVIGTFHQISTKHLDRYIGEFEFRWNRKEDVEIFAAIIIGLVIKDALRYKALTSDEQPSPRLLPQVDDDLPF